MLRVIRVWARCLELLYFARSSSIGRREDAKGYDELFDGVRRAFNEAYVAPDGRIEGDTQTCYVLALHMDLLPEELRPAAAEHLVAAIERENWHLSTGFVGVGYLCPVLTETEHSDVAYRLLGNDTFPSWGYTIRNGATTIWERWDGWTEEKGFQSPNMNSFNHYSLGSVGEWLYRYVAGIDLDPRTPGYSRIVNPPVSGWWPDARKGRVRLDPRQDRQRLEHRGRPVRTPGHHPPQHEGHGSRTVRGRSQGHRGRRAAGRGGGRRSPAYGCGGGRHVRRVRALWFRRGGGAVTPHTAYGIDRLDRVGSGPAPESRALLQPRLCVVGRR